MPPKRKKTRNVGPDQPTAAPTQRLADATVKKNREIIHAASWRRRRASHRSSSDRVKAVATNVAAAFGGQIPAEEQQLVRSADDVASFLSAFSTGVERAGTDGELRDGELHDGEAQEGEQ